MMLRNEPKCRSCGRLSETVHHLEPVVKRPDLAMDQRNCYPCCRECHRLLDAGLLKPKPPPFREWNGAM